MRRRCSRWVLTTLLGGGLASVAAASPPQDDDVPYLRHPSGARPGELPPPPEATAGETGAAVEPLPLTEEQKYAQRLRQFDLHYLQAQSAAQRERWDEAIAAYSQALELLPGDPTALLGRAFARKAKAGPEACSRRAIGDLLELAKEDPKGAWLQQRMVAIEWMGACGARYARRRLALARELSDEAPGTIGRPDDVRVTLAEMLAEAAAAEDVRRAERARYRRRALEQLERYREESVAQGKQPSARGLSLMADLHRQQGDLTGAIARYGELLQLHPKDPLARDARRVREELAFEVELQQLDETQGFRPTDEAMEAYTRGTRALAGGAYEEAVEELTWALEESPWFPRAYYSRGIAHARMQRFSKAIDDLSRAVRMDRSDYRAHMALGLIYKKEFAGAEDDEAIKHLSAALRLRPDLFHLHMLLGGLFARTDRQKAREHYQRFIQLAPLGDPDARRAREALEELEREIRRDEPTTILPPAEESLRFLEPKLQRMINEAYLRGTEHQDWESAEAILVEARREFPDEPAVLNELARVVYHQNRHGDARQHWEESLSMREDQVEVHERLGLLLRSDLADQAIPHLRRAAELGSTTARFNLAELLWEQNHPIDAREQLQVYFAQGSEWEDPHWERAVALREEIERRFLQFWLITGLLSAVAIAVPGWRLYRFHRGSSLRQLLERSPKSFPEVARILSLIRHEILKHNTGFLSDVGVALELDAPDAEQRAEVLGRRLFGEGSHDERGGIHGRFGGYLDDLEKVGRAHRVTLNLQRKDPIFRPMIQSFDALARRAAQLRRAGDLRPSAKLELARCLARAGHVLGRQAFERLSELIRELCVTQVDPALVQRVYELVQEEKQFVGLPIADLEVAGEGAAVRIFRTDLEDILANVFRNSLRSSILYASPPIRLAVALVTEIDEITGLRSLAIRIKDRSSEQLSNEMLRGRYVERGMGITVDLLSRYDGAIGVESEAGWSKAVVLRFFVLEDADGGGGDPEVGT